MSKNDLLVAANDAEFLDNLKKLVLESANAALKSQEKFSIGLSGGSCIKYMVGILKNVDISNWLFFFCDERVVPEDSPDSTYGAYIKAFNSAQIQYNPDQFVKIKQGVSASDAAQDYLQKVAFYFPAQNPPKFDCLILGMGPDGHTCSLFPGHSLVESEKVVEFITDSPKPPSDRITLTLPVLNAARTIIFTVAGGEKADVLEKILIQKDQQFPPARITGNVYWVLDIASSEKLL